MGELQPLSPEEFEIFEAATYCENKLRILLYEVPKEVRDIDGDLQVLQGFVEIIARTVPNNLNRHSNAAFNRQEIEASCGIDKVHDVANAIRKLLEKALEHAVRDLQPYTQETLPGSFEELVRDMESSEAMMLEDGEVVQEAHERLFKTAQEALDFIAGESDFGEALCAEARTLIEERKKIEEMREKIPHGRGFHVLINEPGLDEVGQAKLVEERVSGCNDMLQYMVINFAGGDITKLPVQPKVIQKLRSLEDVSKLVKLFQRDRVKAIELIADAEFSCCVDLPAIIELKWRDRCIALCERAKINIQQ